MGIEIEKKFTIKHLPKDVEKYPYHLIEQAYLNVHPAIRVRREDDSFYMTYKGVNGAMVKEEYNLFLDEKSYTHLLEKADGIVISKKRVLIPLNENAFSKDYLDKNKSLKEKIEKREVKIELDIFEKDLEGICFAEVEFPTVEDADNYIKADWFLEEVTGQKKYSNAFMSRCSKDEIKKLFSL